MSKTLSVVPFAVCALLIGLTACTRAVSPMSDNISVLPAGTDAPINCASLGVITVSDGIAEGHGGFDGTEAGALKNLRNAAAKLGANVLVPLEKGNPENPDIPLDPIFFDCAHCKKVVMATGHAYRCTAS